MMENEVFNMRWILLMLPEIAAGVILLLPLLLLCQRFLFHNWRRTGLYLVFGAYLIAMLCFVGFPNIRYFCFDANLNLIPFIGMADSIQNTFLNVLLFIPLGFFLPLLWERYRKAFNMLVFAFFTTLFIELSQLFTYRATDVDDLITNVIGGLCGYLLARAFTKDFQKHTGAPNPEAHLVLLCGCVLFVMFFLQPFLYPLFWELF